jgi:hypothetical protein
VSNNRNGVKTHRSYSSSASRFFSWRSQYHAIQTVIS